MQYININKKKTMNTTNITLFKHVDTWKFDVVKILSIQTSLSSELTVEVLTKIKDNLFGQPNNYLFEINNESEYIENIPDKYNKPHEGNIWLHCSLEEAIKWTAEFFEETLNENKKRVFETVIDTNYPLSIKTFETDSYNVIAISMETVNFIEINAKELMGYLQELIKNGEIPKGVEVVSYDSYIPYNLNKPNVQLLVPKRIKFTAIRDKVFRIKINWKT